MMKGRKLKTEEVEYLSNEDIAELQGLLRSEADTKWATGDWLVAKVEALRAHWTGQRNHNGRDGIVRDAARRTGGSEHTLLGRYKTSLTFPVGTRRPDNTWSLHHVFSQNGGPVWMDEYLDYCIEKGLAPTARNAYEWTAMKTGQPDARGTTSSSEIVRALASVKHPDQKVAEVLENLPDELKRKVGQAVARDSAAAAGFVEVRKAQSEQTRADLGIKHATLDAEQVGADAMRADRNAASDWIMLVHTAAVKARAALNLWEKTNLSLVSDDLAEVYNSLVEAEGDCAILKSRVSELAATLKTSSSS